MTPKVYIVDSKNGFDAYFISPNDRNRITVSGKEKDKTVERSLQIIKQLGFSRSKVLDMTKKSA